MSTTDPDARVMKMADGGFRPAYNVQLATDVDSRGIVGVTVTNLGSDRSSVPPMLTQLRKRTGRLPTRRSWMAGVSRAPRSRRPRPWASRSTRRSRRAAARRRAATDRLSRRPRMARSDGDARGARALQGAAATAEWVHADARTHRTLGAIPVRGLKKVHTWALWIALAHNMIRLMEIVPHLMT